MEPDGCPLVLIRKLHPSFKGAVGHRDVIAFLSNQMLHRQLRHLPGADEHDFFAGQFSENFTGQLDGGIADGDRMITDAGFGTNAFGDKKGAVQQPVENNP